MRQVPEIVLALANLISLGESSGTGFMYCSDRYLYLVTAKHVLFNDQDKLRTTEIEILAHTTVLEDESVLRFQVDINKLKYSKHHNSDVAVIQIGKVVYHKGEKTKINYLSGVTRVEDGNSTPILSSKRNVCNFEDVMISNDVFIIGYPTSLGLKSSPQFDYTKPLLRKGIVANVYKDQKTIILDCPVYHGNSGGPVIQYTDDIDGKKLFKLIGVISQYIPFVKKWRNDRDESISIDYLNSGYSIAVSVDYVIELIDLLEKPK
ncbi:S1 family peptidase [Flavobacterium sp.]|uniref:S1 family peptidase n=1 Tax=Flavobacterium sp. TaxID=239 RepID=UPI0039E6E142